jgi:hypothetical protein
VNLSQLWFFLLRGHVTSTPLQIIFWMLLIKVCLNNSENRISPHDLSMFPRFYPLKIAIWGVFRIFRQNPCVIPSGKPTVCYWKWP